MLAIGPERHRSDCHLQATASPRRVGRSGEPAALALVPSHHYWTVAARAYRDAPVRAPAGRPWRLLLAAQPDPQASRDHLDAVEIKPT